MEIGIFNETDENLEEYMDKLNGLLEFALKREKLDNVEFNIIFVDIKSLWADIYGGITGIFLNLSSYFLYLFNISS